MIEEFSFKFLGNINNFDELLSDVSSLCDDDWNRYQERKNTQSIAGGYSDTIPLIYDTKMRIEVITKHEKYKQFEKYLNEIKLLSCNYFGNVEIKQAMMTRLKSGSVIKKHKDVGQITSKTHRLHLPIITNPDCIFTVENESMNLKVGDVWAIDNVGKYHSVVNNGITNRVHLIVDVI